ncbi:MAG TPA: hypothetical protein VEZ20_02600 [Allosphingosinicella sp.]|nr:hypothetical protein [Allosphingosinicella sp.]
MNAILLAALLASPQAAAPDPADLRCYRLMADLARAEEPAARALGLSAAHFFIGRIDAAVPGYDLARAPAVPESERADLLARCTQTLGASGFDPEGLGERLDRPQPTA